MKQKVTYAAAGVDIDAADEAVRRLAPLARSTFRPEVLSDVGAFGSVVAMPAGYREPVLVSGNDGAGTKTAIAQTLGRYDTIGIDVVAMCVDDIATLGAEPLFFLDQITVGRVDPDVIEAVVEGLAAGCRMAGCALTGGEIAEHPDLMAPDDVDVAGFAVGVAERDALPSPSQVRPGDVLVGLGSPGLRANGYSLVRRVLLDGRDLDEPAWPGAASSLGDELLRPSVVYAPTVLAAFRELDVHGAAHVTGGGLAANLQRVLPPIVDGLITRGSWEVPPIFDLVAREGPVGQPEMERVFNLGIGMVVIVPGDQADAVIELAAGRDHPAWVIGRVVEGQGRVGMMDR